MKTSDVVGVGHKDLIFKPLVLRKACLFLALLFFVTWIVVIMRVITLGRRNQDRSIPLRRRGQNIVDTIPVDNIRIYQAYCYVPTVIGTLTVAR